MSIKVFKKLMILTLMLTLGITAIPAYALTYSGGPKDYELDRSMMLSADKVSLSGDTIRFSAGGRVTFDVLLPFDAVRLDFKYEELNKDVNLKIETDEHNYSAVLLKKTTETSVDISEVSASRTITLKADKALTLKSVNFHKVNEKYNELNTSVPPFDEYEDALVTLVALKCNVGVVKTRNNLLRWDTEDIYVAPENINGSIYAPAKKLAEALLLYCEDYEDLKYLYMLDETSSLSLKDGKGYYEDNEEGRKDLDIDVRYKNGKAWVPVRKTAELFGHTVGYKDGYVLIGDRLRIKKVFETESLLKELEKEFKNYIIPSQKPQGTTYHVAKTKKASDANSGTEEFPFATIQKAADIAKAGDTVIVHEGTYRETVTVKNDGTSMSPITFKAADGEKVVISALEKLSGFIEYKGDILCAVVPINLGDGRNQLFYNGEQLMAGRHPNEDTKPGVLPYPPEVPKGLYATRGNIMITDMPHGEIAYSDTDLNQTQKDYWKGGLYVSLKGAGWSIATGDIVSSSYGQLKLKDHEGSKSFNLGIGPSERHGAVRSEFYYDVHDTDYAYITNHINTVDIPGEWYMRDNIIFVIPPEGADLDNDLEIKQRQLCIDLRGRSYVTFDGIDTIGGSMTGDEATGCTLLNGEFKYVAHHTRQLDANNYSMYVDESSYSHDSQKKGETGFYFGGSYNAMVNCVIDTSSATGIAINNKYNYISNNVIKNCSYSGGYPGCIYNVVDNNRAKADPSLIFGGHFITYNTLYNAGRNIYQVGSGMVGDTYYAVSPSEFAYNRCFNGSLTARDTGIVYEYGHTGGNDVAKTTMHHNFVYDAGHWDKDTGSMLMLLYHDGYTASRDTYSNIAWYDDPERPVQYSKGIFVQEPQYTVVRSRNNSELGLMPDGDKSFERADYPGGRMFGVGADHGEYAEKFIKNYEAHIKGETLKKPYDVKLSAETNTETFCFKDINIESGVSTILNYFMSRKYGITNPLNITARVYDKEGNPAHEVVTSNDAVTGRFYVKDVHKGIVILPPLDAGTYDVELELSDTYSDIYYIIPKNLDTTYDSRYSKEDEEAGVICYKPKDAQIDEETGKQTYTFEDVKFESDIKTLFKMHLTRLNNKDSYVEVVAKVYNKQGELITETPFVNILKNTTPQAYEVLEGTVIVKELEAGTYDMKIEMSDAYSTLLRILPEAAAPEYDNLFDYPEVFLGGSYDDWTPGETYDLDLSRTTNYTLDNISKFTHFAAGNCWDNTVYYKDRTISSPATMIRITESSGQGYSGSTVKLYVDSLDSEPIATWTAAMTQWQPETKYVKLDRTLEAGKHTFIFQFSGDNLCSTLWNFAFCNKEWDMDLEK